MAKTLASKLRALATKHREELGSLIDAADARAVKAFEDFDGSKWGELRDSLIGIVQDGRTESRVLAKVHAISEMSAVIGKANAAKLVLDAGANPKASEIEQYVDNAIDATKAAAQEADEAGRAAVIAHNAYRAKTIVESESTVSYETARKALRDSLLAMDDEDAEALGFRLAQTDDELRSAEGASVELRDDQTRLAIVGERWDARADACTRCASVHGEVRPIGFAFSEPGPTVHAKCQCIRTLWAVLIPLPSKERDAMPHDSAQPAGRGNPGIAWLNVDVDTRAIKIDEATRTIRGAIASDESVDSHGSKIVAKGWKLDKYNKSNPILMWNHAWARYSCPAKPKDMLGNAPAAVKGKQLLCDLRFDTKEINESAEMVYQQMKAGTVRMLSVGFRPLKYHYEAQGEGQRDLLVIDEAELLEISVVPIGANGNANAGLYAMKGEEVVELRDLCPPEVPPPASTRSEPETSVVGDSHAAGACAGACPDSHVARTLMDKTILEVFGLKADAPETEVLAAATRQRDQLASLITLLGAKNYDEAVGSYRALQSVAAKVPELEKRGAELEGEIVKRDRDQLIRDHARKFTPHELGDEGWVKSASLPQLQAFIKSAPDRVPAAPTEQRDVPTVRELTDAERKVCKSANLTEDEYRKMLAEQEGGAK